MPWGLDLGTHNTLLTRWSAAHHRPEAVVLNGLARPSEGLDDLTPRGLIPSATYVEEEQGFWTWAGRLPGLEGRVFWGRHGWIGQDALGRSGPALVPTFKHWLGRASLAPVLRIGNNVWTAREIAAIFLRELLSATKQQHGETPEELVITAPVEAFEGYRAEVSSLLQRFGVKKIQWIDEPVAAAIGYGLGLTEARQVLVVDNGAGTFHLAVVRFAGRDMARGQAEVLAKVGRPVGGNHVDAWILDALLAEVGMDLPDSEPFWRRLLLDEARRVKEVSYSRGRELFYFHPEVQHLLKLRQLRDHNDEIWVDQPRIRAVLEQRGFFTMMAEALAELGEHRIDDVLLVGGSTLLPGVFPFFEERFGRDRVRGWRPFEAVAFGAATFAAGALTTTDHLAHDYAIQIWEGGRPSYVPIIQRGTRLPTRPDHWRQQLVPTCARGVPETYFKLVICEMGAPIDDERLFGWDAAGKVHVLRAGEERLVVPLNEQNPTLGDLNPPHLPGDTHPRLDVTFHVDADRWLRAKVTDLKNEKVLMDNQPVVRLI